MDSTTFAAVSIPAVAFTAALFRYLTFRDALKDTKPREREKIIRAIGQMNKDTRLSFPETRRQSKPSANEDDEPPALLMDHDL
ncbi:hypothetical protein [Nocardia sp. NPDC051570]|uniref:hypothetical protein n=1 Tax=Nocardia sp. NPDC051570 TaxID=3364324 RepID=UPI0037BD63A2